MGGMGYELSNKRVVIAGGASFISFHLSQALLERGVKELVLVDNLKSGKGENVKELLRDKRVRFERVDLRDEGKAREVLRGEVVFHMAAVHGGRGFIGWHDAECVDNFLIDRNVVMASLSNGVEQFFFASSGCVYPLRLQRQGIYPLKEEDLDSDFNPDGVYGMAKLAAEVLLALKTEKGKKMRVAIGRLFTVYGERALENHAVMGLIAKAFVGMDPYVIWGKGNQVRNWTYVKDIVTGILTVVERGSDWEVVNIGSEEQTPIREAVELIFELSGFRPKKVVFDEKKPVGPVARVADISLMKEKFGWQPKWSFREGLERTLKWYWQTKDRDYVRANLQKLLTEIMVK